MSIVSAADAITRIPRGIKSLGAGAANLKYIVKYTQVIWLVLAVIVANVIVSLLLGDNRAKYWRLQFVVNIPLLFVAIPGYLILSYSSARSISQVAYLIAAIFVIAFSILYITSVVLTPMPAKMNTRMVITTVCLVAFYTTILIHMKDYIRQIETVLQKFNISNDIVGQTVTFILRAGFYIIFCFPVDVYDSIKHGKDALGVAGKATMYLIAGAAICLIAFALFRRLIGAKRGMVTVHKGSVYTTKRTDIGTIGSLLTWDMKRDHVYQTMYPDGSEESRIKDIRKIWNRSQYRRELFEVLNKGNAFTRLKSLYRFGYKRHFAPLYHWLIREDETYYRMTDTSAPPEPLPPPNQIAPTGTGDREISRVHLVAYTLSFWLYIPAHAPDHREDGNIIKFGDGFSMRMENGMPCIVSAPSSACRSIETIRRQKWSLIAVTRDELGRVNVFVDSVLHMTYTGQIHNASDNEEIYIGDHRGPTAVVKECYYYDKIVGSLGMMLLQRHQNYLV